MDQYFIAYGLHAVVTVKTAATYLHELRDFAMAQESPGLLELITRSQTIVEGTMFYKGYEVN